MKKFFKPIRALVVSLLVIALFGVFLYVFRGNKKQIAPYEYIRRAYAYMDNGKYEKGIALLHKAYDALPESDNIRNNLMHGYLRYALTLDKEEKTDSALDLLSTAYDIDNKNLDVIRNLAYLYCQQAISYSRSFKGAQAMDHFHKGIDIAMRSKRARKSISNYLFNMAVEAYNENDHNTVILCLRSSYTLWNRFGTLKFLGQHYYRKSEPERALFYWEKAEALDSENEEIKDRLEMVRKDIAVNQEMKDIQTQYFNIKIHRQYEINVNELEEMLKTVYVDVGRDLKYYPPKHTPIIFYSEEDFKDIFKQPYIVRALYDGSIRFPIYISIEDPAFIATMAHEYTHAVVSIITENRCPTWINEGVACYEQSKYVPMDLRQLNKFLEEGNVLSIQLLQEGFESLGDDFKTVLSYQGSYTAVSFMIDKWGWNGFLDLLGKIRDGRHYANAIDEEFLISEETFEKMWNEYVKEKIL